MYSDMTMTTELITFNHLTFIWNAILAANRARSELTRLKCKLTRKWKTKDVDETPVYVCTRMPFDIHTMYFTVQWIKDLYVLE